MWIYKKFSFLRGGYFLYSSGNLSNRGSGGGYWESKIYSDTSARSLNFYSSILNLQRAGVRGNGFSIRCVVKP